jgi:hypothetical protein
MNRKKLPIYKGLTLCYSSSAYQRMACENRICDP